MTPLPLATVTEVRRAFYDEHPQYRPPSTEQRKVVPGARKDATVAFGLFVAELARNGEITPELINRVTL